MFFFFEKLHFTTVCEEKAFSPVLEKGMFCLIQGPCIWERLYCEVLHIISLLLQKFPFKHKATINKYIDTVDRWTDRQTHTHRYTKKTGRKYPWNYSCRRLFQRHYFPQVMGLSQIWRRNEIASSEKPD